MADRVITKEVPTKLPQAGPPPQQVIWTALPNGISPAGGVRKLKLSVFVSPRLSAPGVNPTLGHFPDFVTWADKVKDLQFSVTLANSQNRAPAVTLKADRTSDAPDPQLWAALFQANTLLNPYKPERFSAKTIISYPTRNVYEFIKLQHQQTIGINPTVQPSRAALMPVLESAALHPNQPHPVAGHAGPAVRANFNVNEAILHEAARPADAQMDFFQARLFHHPDPGAVLKRYSAVEHNGRPPASIWQHTPIKLAAKPVIPPYDFHQIVSTVGEYPTLLRKLGLAFDLEVTLPAAAPAHIDTISVQPAWTPDGSSMPRTMITGLDAFTPAPQDANADFDAGLLKLSSDLFALMQIDIDGAAIKTQNFATHLVNMAIMTPNGRPAPIAAAAPATAEPEDAEGLPSLRSTGITVVRNGRAEKLLKRTLPKVDQNNADLEKGQAPVIYADEIERGVRVDVRRIRNGKPEPWMSLCRRDGTYAVAGSNMAVTVKDEEGTVSLGLTRNAAATDADTHKLHEAIFRWAGWSLAVPAPLPGGAPAGNPPRGGIQTNFSVVPGSLPVLRFGRTYQLRARVVDLAGNSLGPDIADDTHATAPTTYHRFEPVNPPAVVPTTDLSKSPGESVHRIVIHSNFDRAAFADTSSRHIAPPKVGLSFAETHGVFDDADGKPVAAAMQQAAGKADGTLKAIHPEPRLALPYLPDPLSIGATIVGLDQPVSTPFFPANGTWPAAQPFELKVVGIKEDAAPQPPAFDGSALTIQLPQAHVAHLRISSMIDPAKVSEIMGLWHWADQFRTDPRNAAMVKHLPPVHVLNQEAAMGLHSSITPFQEIVLVHAVQQPLLQPVFQSFTPYRDVGNTFVHVETTIKCDALSTSKLDVLCTWKEPIDDPADPAGPQFAGGPALGLRPAAQRQAVAFEIPIHLDEPIKFIAPLHLGQPAAKAPIRITANKGKAAYHMDQKMLVLGAVVDNIRRIDNLPHHEFGDTKRHYVSYNAIATTRFREYFPEAITADPKNITRQSDPLAIDIPSSRRPDAPKVLYVVPVFPWSKDVQPNSIDSKRAGGGLRVYMDRPWFSSGTGEQLGVVLWQQPAVAKVNEVIAPAITLHAAPVTREPVAKHPIHIAAREVTHITPLQDIPQNLRSYVTQWGADPIWGAPGVAGIPGADQFQQHISSAQNLTLAELPNIHVSVVGYAAGYDPQRNLWYCDIQLDPGEAYFPFVRLALARFQPNSVPDTHLSRIVTADFVQLTPERSASIVFDLVDPKSLHVTINGPAYTATAASRGGASLFGPSVEVLVERKVAGGSGETGWTPVREARVAHDPAPASIVAVAGPLWRGTVALPEPRHGGQFRLVIIEREPFMTDDPTSADGRKSETTSRIVYADTIEL
jgi:hypothetical protein